VPCGTSRVVPGAHRVVCLGTHRGSGPREVHTTPATGSALERFAGAALPLAAGELLPTTCAPICSRRATIRVLRRQIHAVGGERNRVGHRICAGLRRIEHGREGNGGGDEVGRRGVRIEKMNGEGAVTGEKASGDRSVESGPAVRFLCRLRTPVC
jgi:hypothetical protein